MGRHSSGDRWPYLRSVTGWALPWIVIAVIVGVVVWVAVGAVGGGSVTVGRTSSETSPSAEPSPIPPPTPSPASADRVAPKDDKEEEPKPPAPASTDDLVTEGVVLQVVNGTGGIEGAAEAMANRLAELGYEIYAINTGLTIDRTTVYWSTAAGEEAAIALAAHFGWEVALAPGSLSPDVDLHVVVGPDEAG